MKLKQIINLTAGATLKILLNNMTHDQKKAAFVASVIAICEINPDGFTVNANTFEPVAGGFSVAIKETQNSFGIDGIEAVFEAVAAGLANFVGGWYDSETGLFYFDAVNIYDDKNQAIKAGRENKQIAIFDLNTLTEIRL